MNSFYQLSNSNGRGNSWFYSGRGILTQFIYGLLPQNPGIILENARNLKGSILGRELGKINSWLTLGKFELGEGFGKGFGFPDGGLFLEVDGRGVFVFIEAKTECLCDSFIDPEEMKAKWELITRNPADFKNHYWENFLHTVLNGELELYWRFANACKASIRFKKQSVTEAHVKLADDIVNTDRFYWKTRKVASQEWRSVDLTGKRSCLYELLCKVERFVLLAISNDVDLPRDYLRRIRLFDQQGNAIHQTDPHVYWMSLGVIKDMFSAA